MEINAQLVKQLRERTGAGMMECKSALTEAKGDIGEAEVVLRKRGIASAAKKSARSTKQGVIASYIHPGAQLGVLIEVNCESDFVARTEDFQELVHDLAMQVAAADPQFIRKEDVTPAALDKEREIQRARALDEGKPEKMVDKIVEGRMNKFYEEVCLYEQPFIKENTTTVADLIKTKIAKLGENISVSRFVRFKVGDSVADARTSGKLIDRAEIRTHPSQTERRGAGRRGLVRHRCGACGGARRRKSPRWRGRACRSAWWWAAAISSAAWPRRRRTWTASRPTTWACWPR